MILGLPSSSFHSSRVIDSHFQYEAKKIGAKASSAIVREQLKEVNQLGKFVASFKVYKKEMKETGMPLYDQLGIEIIKLAVKDIKDLKFLTYMSGFEQKPPHEETLDSLLDGLESHTTRASGHLGAVQA